MSKRRSSFDLALPPNTRGLPAYEWLYRSLRAQILEGRLRPGARLPSTRDFAARYGLARGTIVTAFDVLKSEGYLHGTTGAGTFVADLLPDELLQAAGNAAAGVDAAPARYFSEYGARVQTAANFETTALTAFSSNVPALDLFPIQLWSSIAARVMRRAATGLLVATDPKGFPPLREAVSDYLNAWRGVRCTPDRIVIVSGVQEALDMCARIFIAPGDRVCIEDPGYAGAAHVFRAAGAEIVPVPVDDEGFPLQEDALRGARLAYVTPGHQAPLGMTMSLRRRLALLEYAQRNGMLIFEDDYDSEYRYSSRPIAAMQGLDAHGAVIFAGSFNKVLFPSLRMGYLVAPPDLVDKFEAVKSQSSRHAPIIDQLILHEFIAQGHFARHLRRMREAYADRFETLRKETRAHLRDMLEVSDAEAGLETVGWLADGLDGVSVAKAAAGKGIVLTPLQQFAYAPLRRDGVQMGFAGITPSEIRRAVRALAGILRSLLH